MERQLLPPMDWLGSGNECPSTQDIVHSEKQGQVNNSHIQTRAKHAWHVSKKDAPMMSLRASHLERL